VLLTQPIAPFAFFENGCDSIRFANLCAFSPQQCVTFSPATL
jgi:hypothetical protein